MDTNISASLELVSSKPKGRISSVRKEHEPVDKGFAGFLSNAERSEHLLGTLTQAEIQSELQAEDNVLPGGNFIPIGERSKESRTEASLLIDGFSIDSKDGGMIAEGALFSEDSLTNPANDKLMLGKINGEFGNGGDLGIFPELPTRVSDLHERTSTLVASDLLLQSRQLASSEYLREPDQIEPVALSSHIETKKLIPSDVLTASNVSSVNNVGKASSAHTFAVTADQTLTGLSSFPTSALSSSNQTTLDSLEAINTVNTIDSKKLNGLGFANLNSPLGGSTAETSQGNVTLATSPITSTMAFSSSTLPSFAGNFGSAVYGQQMLANQLVTGQQSLQLNRVSGLGERTWRPMMQPISMKNGARIDTSAKSGNLSQGGFGAFPSQLALGSVDSQLHSVSVMNATSTNLSVADGSSFYFSPTYSSPSLSLPNTTASNLASLPTLFSPTGAVMDAGMTSMTATITSGETQTPSTQSSSGAGLLASQKPTPFGHRNWSQHFGQQISQLATQKITQAQVIVDPPELGPIQVQMRFDSEQALQLQFKAAHGEVREAIEQSLANLEELLEEEGIALADANVGSFENDDQRGMGQEQGRTSELQQRTATSTIESQIKEADTSANTVNSQKTVAAIDIFA